MKLTLKRHTFTNKSTIGSLFVDGVFECYVLEDVTRLPNVKVQNETAIPYGTYPVTITFSNRFKKLMPQILDVPMFAGIRIHSGNKAEDTEGCLIVGTSKSVDWVSGSKLAFKPLFDKLQKADKKEKITIEVIKDVS